MTKILTRTNRKNLLKTLGPGLLFAGTAIGTSHLVLSTRAGAHYGMIFFWIILGTQILKYPFFEFGSRYSSATGNSLLQGFKDQGKWAVILFMLIIFIDMFAVTGAVGAVCGGLLSSTFGLSESPMPVIVGFIFVSTAIMLIIGKYTALDTFMKLISIVLFFTVLISFIAVLVKGPIEATTGLKSPAELVEGAGLALTIGLIGFMPTGMEISVIQSIWAIEKAKVTNYKPTLKESLFDFNLGYIFTTVLALMFVVIGAFTVYGSGQLLEGDAVTFTAKLLEVFTTNLGEWSYYVVAVAAFGTIYGTFIAAWDAFARGFVRGMQVFNFETIEDNKEQQHFLSRYYNIILISIGVGGYLLYYLFTGGMVKILEAATVTLFLTTPIIAFLNLRAITGKNIPDTHKPSKGLLLLAYLGLLMMIVFTIYYLWSLI
jgi:Mn2+/Fe2+ NRAMP family transporter